MNKKNYRKQTIAETKKPSINTNLSKPKEEKAPLTITRTAAITIALVVTTAVVALGIYYLIVCNSDMLYMAQLKDFFTTDRTYLEECMRQPGGMISWVSSYLTQYFFHPTWGAGIMIALWVLSLWLSKWAFNVKMAWMALLAIPFVCLLVSTISIGYWLYYVKQTGYWFYGTVGYLAAMLLVLFNRYFNRKKADSIITTTLVAITYPFAGWYTLLALLYIAANAYVKNFLSEQKLKEKDSITDSAEESKDNSLLGRIATPLYPLLLIVFVPWISRQFYAEMRIEDAWTIGFPEFTNDKLVSYAPTIPFIIMAAVPLLFPFLPKRAELKGGMGLLTYVVTIAVLVGSYLWSDKKNFDNYNYHAEMRMYRAADEQD